MAMDIRLIKANEDLCTIAFDKGCDSEEYEAASLEYIEAFKVVAAERGESVIAWENPYDTIMEAIYDGKNPERALIEYKRMIDALESIGYSNLGEWQDNYNECISAMKEARI